VVGVLTCTRQSLEVATAPVIVVTAIAPESGPLTSTATVTSATLDPSAGNDSDTAETVVTHPSQSANLFITILDAPDPVNAGGALAYVLSVTNNGPDPASGLVVTDLLPAGLTNVTGSGNGWTCGAPVSGVLTCTRPSLAIVTAPLITIAGIAPPSGPLHDSATVASSTSDPNPTDNSETEETTVIAAGEGADLSITTGDAPDPVEAGQPITWTLNVSNIGGVQAFHITVVDMLPPGVSQARGTGEGWTCRSTATTVFCLAVLLPPGPAPPITITAVAPGTAGVITNEADVSAESSEPVYENNVAYEDTTVLPVHDMAVLRIEAPARVRLGASVPSKTVRVRVQIQNRSPHDERIADAAMLASLVRLTARSLGACPEVQGVLSGRAQTPAAPNAASHSEARRLVRRGPLHVVPGGSGEVDERRSGPRRLRVPGAGGSRRARRPGRRHPADDVCPRTVAPPFVVDRYPDGSILDRGCGRAREDRTFGDPVTTDVWVR
jgi:uncharacterized repeat protein (TIGR01451 family)